MDKVVAIVLAGGQGKRMQSNIAKQYMTIQDKPILYYTIKAFEQSAVDEIIVVADDVEYCNKHVVQKYAFNKVIDIVTGGKERYDSVFAGLSAIKQASYVLIHDGARPCIKTELINQCIEKVVEKQSVVVAVPVKDTIKYVNGDKIEHTPDRKLLWSIQTPQCFDFQLIKDAYIRLQSMSKASVTDDAMVLEQTMGLKATVIQGDYQNIKVTTPEDIKVANLFLN